MKWNCDLIQDLLPLYEEGLCSPSSRQAVEEHLGECDACRRLAAPLPIEAPPETPAADRAVKRSIKKVRRQWLLSLIASLLAVPLLLMSVNQYRGRGLCFTNIDDILTARAFLAALEQEDWTRAAELHDYSDNYASILEALEMTRQRHESGKDYDVVMLDLKMPDLDGIGTVRRIRAEVSADIPILLTSAYDWSDIEDTAKEAGVNGFIGKPLFRSRLYEKISELLGTEAKALEAEDDHSDLAGMHILIAEDNDINWEIISAMLGMYGITSERAENGRICVEKMAAAEEGQYDLIFMDIQMPEMNGLDATRNIRALENPWAAGIPIIAMTADAFSENVAECLKAGMNGHIAKPIDLKLVIKEIRRIKEEKKK